MPSYQRIPTHLKKYTVRQDYRRYTARDHAAWRYIMQQSRDYFRKHAHSAYIDGLTMTAISTEMIPRIEDMDAALSKFGWGAIAVRGFIPPAAFIELQALKILPIATDMRTIEHISYTPAPDIVHEAAGHAPIIAHPDYARYLTSYAALAKKAIYSKEDIQLYEAIRVLSDLKENPDTKPGEIEIAQETLDATIKSLRYVSEATKVARMYWWTVEYGLIGDLNNPRIYGAGLLSSVAESRHCLTDKVKKIPLSLACIDTGYDITEPQPQLFVARDFAHLTEVLMELDATLAHRRGGIYGLEQAKLSRAVTTIQLDSGLQISGVLENFDLHAEAVTFAKISGPVQLSYDFQQLTGHGRERHGQGFSSPFGRLKKRPQKPLTHFDTNDLGDVGIEVGRSVRLEYVSGIIVEGKVLNVLRASDGRLLLVTFADCLVKQGEEILYHPHWGEFDLAIGETITSVFGGPADRRVYEEPNLGEATTQPARQTPYSDEELGLFGLYQQVRHWRDTAHVELDQAMTAEKQRELWQAWGVFCDQALREHPKEWLLQLELLELHSLWAQTSTVPEDNCAQVKNLVQRLHNSLAVRGSDDQVVKTLINQGLHLLEMTA